MYVTLTSLSKIVEKILQMLLSSLNWRNSRNFLKTGNISAIWYTVLVHVHVYYTFVHVPIGEVLTYIVHVHVRNFNLTAITICYYITRDFNM